MSESDRDVADAEGFEPEDAASEAEAGHGEDAFVGQGIDRREDHPLLTGTGEYTDDLDAPDLAYLTFVRSPHGHARVGAVDTDAAAAMDGVLGVYTWADLEASESPMVLPVSSGALDVDIPGHPVLAREKVRYDGQPVAAVVAEDRYVARDAAETVDVEYDPLPTADDPVEAKDDDEVTVFEQAPDNVAVTAELGDADATDEAFVDAAHVVSVDLTNNRLIPSALEPRAALATYDAAADELTVKMTSQSPHGHRRKLSHTLGLPENDIRVVAPDVGGGFGHKGHHHPGEAMAAWAARRLDRSVKWTATRSENYRAGAHGRDHETTAELALSAEGDLLGLRVRTDAAVGGQPIGGGAAMPAWYGRLLSSQYAIPAIHCETDAVFTTTAPIHSYRGAGRPEAVYVTERVVDVAASELDFDAVELRRRNLLEPDQFPFETPVGATYDSGDYEPAMEEALDALDGAPRHGVRDDDGRYRGVGVANYVESTGGGFESGVVRVHPDGGVTVYAGTHDHGQGHATTYAQIVADELDLSMGDVEVVEGDTARIPTGTGTFGSRSTIVGGNAVAESARSVRAKARRIAAELLEVPTAEVVLADGEFVTADGTDGGGADGGDGDGDAVDFPEVASAAYGRGLPDDLEPGLEATTFYELEETAYTFGTHAVAVAVDPETGELDVERYVAVDDCGERINPTIVEGQVHGGVAQGLGQARSEAAVYDDGELVTREMLDYALPRASDLPDVETRATVTPSPTNDLGVKGIGEGGTIAAPPALANAVADALSPLGVDHVDMPLTDEAVADALDRARE